MTDRRHTDSRWYGNRILVAVGLFGLSLIALSIRLSQRDGSLTEDLRHFYEFTEMMFSPDHFNYYAAVAQREFTYAHLPLVPYLLAPLMWASRQAGQPDLHSVKALIYAADLAAGVVLYFIARRNGLWRAASLAVVSMWLFSPWVIQAGSQQGHVTSVATLFAFLAILTGRAGWRAGLFWALAVATRTEFVFPAAAASVYYAFHRRRELRSFLMSAGGVFVVVVLPYAIRDLGALWWAVFGHLQGRGNGLQSLRSLFHVFGQPFPEILTGSFDWALRALAPLAILLGVSDRDLTRSLLRVSMVFLLTLTIVHSRYLVMPLSMGLAYGSRPTLVWYLVAWFVIEHAKFVGDITWVFRFLIVLALVIGPLLLGVLYRRGSPVHGSAPSTGAKVATGRLSK